MRLINRLKVSGLIVALLFCIKLSGQHYTSLHTTEENRQVFVRKVEHQHIASALLGGELHHDRLQGALWAMTAFGITTDTGRMVVQTAIQQYDSLSTNNRYALLSYLQSKADNNKDLLFARFALGETQPKLLAFLWAHSTAARSYITLPAEWAFLSSVNFNEELSQQEVNQLLAHLKKQYSTQRHLVLLCRANRDIPAKMMVYNPSKGGLQPLSLVFLARSATNILPYFTNGNTPCGAFRIADIAKSDNVFIGPVPTLTTLLPHESRANTWGLGFENWTMNTYLTLFPQSLYERLSLQQTYQAGEKGRGDIIVHGSTIDPLLFSHTPYYPLTPSLGCMSALELYNLSNGTLMESHQLQLIRTIEEEGLPWGFLYVLQVNFDYNM